MRVGERREESWREKRRELEREEERVGESRGESWIKKMRELERDEKRGCGI